MKKEGENEKKNVLLLVFPYVVNSSGWFKCVECEGKELINFFLSSRL